MNLQEKIMASQSLLIIAVLLSVLSLIVSPLLQILSALLIIIGAYIVYTSGLKGEDCTAVLSAYAFFGIFAILLPYLSTYTMSLGSSFSGLFIIIFILVIGLVLWKAKFERSYAFGMVIIADQKLAGVEIEYDMRSNVRSGRYVVDNIPKAKKGAKVKILVKKQFFSSSIPLEILEVVK